MSPRPALPRDRRRPRSPGPPPAHPPRRPAPPPPAIDPRATILTRLYAVLGLLLLLPLAVAVRLVAIHVAEGGELRARAEQQAESEIVLAAQRGTVFDRAGRALAVNTARYEVAADPTAPGFDDRAPALYALLAEATGRPAAHFRRAVRERASRQYVVLVRDLGEADKERLDAAAVPGLIVTGSYRRSYSYGTTAAHVLGHVTRDLDGVAGVELELDGALQGTPGRQAVRRDGRGTRHAVVGGVRVEPVHGLDVVLTVDLVRQTILEEELARGVEAAGARWGTAVALDPRTGAILALANVPTYDPNRAGAFPEASRRNHAVVDRIEPGSTFKLVTAIAAVEAGAVAPEDEIDTGAGWRVFHGRTLRDTHAHGRISFGEGLVRSSNIAMATAAERMGRAPLYRAARDLGFGQPTLVDLPGEVAGSLRRPDAWGPLTLPTMAIGYAVEATPLQLAVAYAALANGGLVVRPHVVAERRDPRTGRTVWAAQPDSVRRAFRRETADALRPYFESVVVGERGTGRAAAVEGLRVAGKTGTARIATAGGYVNRHRASFVGYFPAEAPEVVLAVILDSPVNGTGGGAVSAPIFGAVARRWVGTFPRVAARVAPAAPVPARTAAIVPRVAGLPGALAALRLRAEGWPVRLDAAALWQPAALAATAPGDTVRLAEALRLAPAARARRAMPDLRGQSARAAVAWLRALGVEPVLRGSGVVRAQSVAAGGRLPRTVTLVATRDGVAPAAPARSAAVRPPVAVAAHAARGQ